MGSHKAWQFDQAGGVHLETRATGILSTSPIDVGKTSPYGTVVAPGVLGTSHQHFISVRIGESWLGSEGSHSSDPQGSSACILHQGPNILQKASLRSPRPAELAPRLRRFAR